MERRDGWLEIKIGSFNSGLKEDQVPLKVKSIRDRWTRSSFIIEGIELRPPC
ncbi:hypothetical protein JHK87_035954 [Glycine soja]|nr:hypothetical protein JHK87_035954 [Glycine soja]KAG4976747.1 hypothetical protein JHK86_036221 [Glycine max]